MTWAIGATRVTDNKHHVADVVAGMLLGGMIATVFALRAIPRVRCAVRACCASLMRYMFCWPAKHCAAPVASFATAFLRS